MKYAEINRQPTNLQPPPEIRDSTIRTDTVVVLEPVNKIFWNAISNKSFLELAAMRPNSKADLHRRSLIHQSFLALEVEYPQIVRGCE
jgi:hypothetical protein